MRERNNNAEKWDAESVIECLLKIEAHVRKEDVFFLGDALNQTGLYRQVWKYWKRKFATHDDIRFLMMRVESLLEARLFGGALKREFAPWVAMFALRHNFGWSDTPGSEDAHAIDAPDEPQEPALIFELANNEALIVPYNPAWDKNKKK